MTIKIHATAIRYEKGSLSILNQQKLPHVEEWITCTNPDDMVEMIKTLKIRGAPLIGVAAVLAIAQLAEKGAEKPAILKAANALKNARPTAVNLKACVERVMSVYELSGYSNQAIIKEAIEIFNEDVRLCDSIAQNGSELIREGETILTYCNTGGLATAGMGTALGVIKWAHQKGKNIHVYACETRPLLQGGRLTAWELKQEGINHTLICDNMAGHLMSLGKVDRIIVGADRIAANGDFANKIGTYSLATLAFHHGIPFYVAAPYTTIDLKCPDGSQIIIEERAGDEVRGVSGNFGSVTWSPVATHVYNPSFDITPSKLVTSYLLDCGVVESLETFYVSK